MELEIFQYTKRNGWTVDEFPNLDSDKTIIFIFAAPEFINDPEPIRELAKHYPKSQMIGCSSAGEIFGARIFDLSLSVAIMQFNTTKIKTIKNVLNNINNGSVETGKLIAEQLNTPNLKGIFVLSDGLNINGSELVAGLNSVVADTVKITGGLAADGKNFKNTWTIFNGEIQNNAVVAIGLYDEKICIGHGSKGGWDIFGPQRIITRSKGNILYELDGHPALALYKEYLGQRANELPASGLLYPLEIRADQDDPAPVVRTILSVNEKEQSLTFAGDVPQGYYAKLMRANFDRLVTSAGETGGLATSRMFKDRTAADRPILCIAISCVGRRLLLGERTEEELESLAESLPTNCKTIGFYSYGELSPFATGTCQLHNQTMTITTFFEE